MVKLEFTPLFSTLQRDSITLYPGMNCTVLEGFFEILQDERCLNKHMLVM